MCRGLEVRKVSTHISNKTPYSRIIWMHPNRTRFCIGKTKNAHDAIDIPLTEIEGILRDGVVPQRFTMVSCARSISLDVDTANSRDILVRMISSVVAHYCAEEQQRMEDQAAFKATLACSSPSSSDDEVDCAICLGPVDTPLQLRCGHTYCAGCIEQWRATASSCPSCREPLLPGGAELLDRAAAFLEMRASQPEKASPEQTARSRAKKTRRAMTLVRQAHAVNPRARRSADGATPICMAAMADGGEETICELAAREKDTNSGSACMGGGTLDLPNGTGATPLHLSVIAGRRQNVKALIALGADLNVTNGDGHTPLEVAITSGNNAIKVELEGAGAVITKKAYAAAVRRRRTTMKLLRRPLWDLFGCYYARPALLPPAATHP
jgi:hypothetical protein